MSDLDLDAIEARSTPRSFYSADGYALLAEVRALRERVAFHKRMAEFHQRRGERFRDERDEALGRVATLEGGILVKCEQWEAEQPDALAFEVTDDFRRLLEAEADRE